MSNERFHILLVDTKCMKERRSCGTAGRSLPAVWSFKVQTKTAGKTQLSTSWRCFRGCRRGTLKRVPAHRFF